MNISNIITKGIGVAALGMVAVDSHSAGKIESSANQKKAKAGGLSDAYFNTLTQDSPSVIQSKIKNKFFGLQLDENLSAAFTGIAGYAKGFSSMLVSNVIPLALSAGIMMTKGITSRVFGAGLLAYGGLFIGREVLGIGKPDSLSTEY